ncbi:hypothetical protein [Paraburkholderia franconis]|uniref:hypothetical protein n=1 Tax=Paraburkholderia franconis TaxID=2654983 RepID=UPI00187B61B3|nr:hypothetical protein [Paraburkholderia franconis]
MLLHQVTNLCNDGGRLFIGKSIGLRLELCDACLYLFERRHYFPPWFSDGRTMPHSTNQTLVSILSGSEHVARLFYGLLKDDDCTFQS